MINHDLYDKLSENNVEIKFTKSDGSERTIVATLQDDIVPEFKESYVKDKEPRPYQSVWEVNEKSWKRFSWDKVIEYKVV